MSGPVSWGQVIGIDPQSREWPSDAQPVFDAAEEGRGLPEALAMLREAIAVRVPDTVVLGLDILDFLQQPSSPSADEGWLRSDYDAPPGAQPAIQIWRDRLATTLTISAVCDSLATLLDQNPSTSVTMTPQGFNPLHEYRVYVSRSGYHELFAQKNAGYEAEYSNLPRPNLADPFRYLSFRYLQKIMDLAARYKIRLILYIHPYHADYLEMLHRVGLWPTFESWKRALVRVAEIENRTFPANAPLYDFAEYDQFTTEPVPPPGDRRSEMRWYWESAHYKSALGDEMLATIFNGSERFGSLLVPHNIDDRLTAIREAELRFLDDGQQRTSQPSRASRRETSQ